MLFRDETDHLYYLIYFSSAWVYQPLFPLSEWQER